MSSYKENTPIKMLRLVLKYQKERGMVSGSAFDRCRTLIFKRRRHEILCNARVSEKEKGESLSYDWSIDKGAHVIHTGGKYDSYLQIPVIPQK